MVRLWANSTSLDGSKIRRGFVQHGKGEVPVSCVCNRCGVHALSLLTWVCIVDGWGQCSCTASLKLCSSVSVSASALTATRSMAAARNSVS